jgi:ribose transport system permease protein
MDSDSQNESKSPARRSLFSHVFSAQESGLVIVIAVMVVALTLLGGTKPKTVTHAIAPGAKVVLFDAAGESHEAGTLPDRKIERIEVTTDGQTVTYMGRIGFRSSGAVRMVTEHRTVNKFLDLDNIVLVLKDASFIAVMAVGMTAVIILAGIDLSVGSIYAIAGVVGAMALHELGPEANGFVAVLLGLGVCLTVGTLCGLANGVMVVGLRVHPFVITLGMMAALRGLTIIIPQEVYGEQSIAGFSPGFTSGFFKAEIAGVYPVPVIIMAIVAVAGAFVLGRTVFGRRVYAIGGNETAAAYAGIPVGRVKIWVYTIMGALSALSATMAIGYYGSAETGAGNAYELRVIAAAVIGGASLMGGRGSAMGAVLGAVIIELIGNAMIIFDIDQSWNQVVMGAAIIVAVVVDQAKRRLSAR